MFQYLLLEIKKICTYECAFYILQVLDLVRHCLAISSQNVVGGQRRRKAPSGAQEIKWSHRLQAAKSPSEGQSLTELIWRQFPVCVPVLGCVTVIHVNDKKLHVKVYGYTHKIIWRDMIILRDFFNKANQSLTLYM